MHPFQSEWNIPDELNHTQFGHTRTILRELEKDPNNRALVRLDMEATAEELRYKKLYEGTVRQAEGLEKLYEERNRRGPATQQKKLTF